MKVIPLAVTEWRACARHYDWSRHRCASCASVVRSRRVAELAAYLMRVLRDSCQESSHERSVQAPSWHSKVFVSCQRRCRPYRTSRPCALPVRSNLSEFGQNGEAWGKNARSEPAGEGVASAGRERTRRQGSEDPCTDTGSHAKADTAQLVEYANSLHFMDSSEKTPSRCERQATIWAVVNRQCDPRRGNLRSGRSGAPNAAAARASSTRYTFRL